MCTHARNPISFSFFSTKKKSQKAKKAKKAKKAGNEMFFAYIHESIKRTVLAYTSTFIPGHYYVYGSTAQNTHVPLWAQVQPRDLDLKVAAVSYDDFTRRCNDICKYVMDKIDPAVQTTVSFSFRKNVENTTDLCTIYVNKVTCVDIVMESMDVFEKRKLEKKDLDDIKDIVVISLDDLVEENKQVLAKCVIPFRLKKEQQRHALFEKILKDAKTKEEIATKQKDDQLAAQSLAHKARGMLETFDATLEQMQSKLDHQFVRLHSVQQKVRLVKERQQKERQRKKTDMVSPEYASINLIQKLHELCLVKESQIQTLTLGVKQYEALVEEKIQMLSSDIVDIMYGGNRETTVLFIQQYIQRVIRRFPILHEEESILNLGMRSDELLFDYMSRISNYILSHYHDNLAASRILYVPGFLYFSSCSGDLSNAASLINLQSLNSTRPLFSSGKSSSGTSTVLMEEDFDMDDPTVVHFQAGSKESKYEGFERQNHVRVCIDIKNDDAENAWKSERIDRFKSKEVYEQTYSMSQMVSHGWLLMHRIMMYSLLKKLDDTGLSIDEEYKKFQYVSVNVGVIDYRLVTSIGNMMEEYSTLYPNVFKTPLKEYIPIYKSGKLKTNEFMKSIAEEIKKKKHASAAMSNIGKKKK